MSNIYDVDKIKQRLYDYRERERYIKLQLERLEYLKEKISSVSSPVLSDMPKSPSAVQDKMAASVAMVVDLENTINEDISLQETERKYFDSIIKQLKKAEEKTVIQLRYIDCMSWNDIIDLMFGMEKDFLDKEDSYLRRIHKSHKSALENMATYIASKNSL